MSESATEHAQDTDAHYPIVQHVSENTGVLYMHEPDTSKDAWAICETPTEVRR